MVSEYTDELVTVKTLVPVDREVVVTVDESVKVDELVAVTDKV
jgi:hypothetical protein